MDAVRIAVVIPVLDEADRIDAQLDHVRTFGFDEVVVVDGGSRDDTVARVRAHADVSCLDHTRGRGGQLNRGAEASSAEVLLFLHADVRLPPDARVRIREALGDEATVAGAFKTWTVPDAPLWWAPLLHVADLRSRVTRYPYGDQALFVRREAFERVGGFPDQPLLEDLALSHRLRGIGRIARVDARVQVSGRRFVASPLRATLSMNLFPRLYAMGISPERLARWYGAPR